VLNFDFSEEVKMMRDEAHRFLVDRCPAKVVRRALDGEIVYDRDLWGEIARLGWLGVGLPEEFGGSGIGSEAMCVVAGEIGASLAPIPFSSSAYLGAQAILYAGDNAQKSEMLPAIASGECIATLALAEGPGNPSEAAVKTEFRNGKITGLKTPVPDGATADLAIVVARDPGGRVGLYAVPLKSDAVDSKTLRTVDPSRNYASLEFRNAHAIPLLANGDGWSLVQSILDRAAAFVAFEQIGGAEACLTMARNYALDRYAFGRPIASFQAIKHRLADMYVTLELGRAHSYYAAWAISHDAPELTAAASAARIAAIDAYYLNSKENIQIHGGMGFTWEMDCHLYYRRAKMLALLLGSASYWRDRLIGELSRNDLMAAE
jgi:alkylation response protein AidB-like acyl-CoA dehydrogenase